MNLFLQKNRNLPFSYLPLLVAFLCCFACQPNYYYQEEVPIEAAIWTYEQDVDYIFDIQDTTARYNLYLDIHHSTQFPFQNLYTMIQTNLFVDFFVCI